MGLFDWLFASGGRSNVALLPDRIWLSREAKANGLFEDVASAFRSHDPPSVVLLVAHFEQSLVPLRTVAQRCESAGLPVHVLSAEKLAHRFRETDDEERDSSYSMLVLVAERHPLRRHDEEILGFCRSAPCRVRLRFHVALRDPMMRIFAGPQVEGMLKALGMSEAEPIESRMVGRRITAAQKRIAAASHGDSPARSCEEWFRANCPALWREGEPGA